VAGAPSAISLSRSGAISIPTALNLRLSLRNSPPECTEFGHAVIAV
jgi:hypothetical protein